MNISYTLKVELLYKLFKSWMPTLDKWIAKKDTDGEKVEPLFTIFYLDGETMKAEWVREMPKQHSYSAIIKWPSLDNVTICCNIGRGDTDKFPHFIFPSETIYNNVPYLKSHLQKCIRRSNVNLALKTALHLARLDLQELLRRLCIIMVEDAILMPEFPTLVWIMAAVSKGYCLDKKRVYWLFALVAKLALVQIRDPIHEPSEAIEENESPDNKTLNIPKTTLAVSTASVGVSASVGSAIPAPTPIKPKLKQATLNYKVPNPTNSTNSTASVVPIIKTLGTPSTPGTPGTAGTVEAVAASVSATAAAAAKETKKKAQAKKDELDRNWKKWKMYKLKDYDKSVIQSLLFRESYGGMKGDKNMLVDVAAVWFRRFSNNDMNDLALKFYRTQELEPITYISPPEENLRPTEWILAAIDFHVVNNVVMILADKYETLNYEDIKAAIWHHSSKYTNKINLSSLVDKKIETDKALSKTQKAWDLIRPEFYSLASYFLKNNH